MNDLITRQDAINALCDQCSMTAAGDRCKDDFCRDVRSLKKVPSAQKKGEWIEDCGGQTCSICKMNFNDLYPLYTNASYCPNCGADMRGDKNGTH